MFGKLKHWMGSTHFLMKTLKHVRADMNLHVLAYNLKRVMGLAQMMQAMRMVKA